MITDKLIAINIQQTIIIYNCTIKKSRKVRKLMNDSGLTNVLLTGGGIIPETDMKALSQNGVGKLFGPGTPVNVTIEYIEGWVSDNRN